MHMLQCLYHSILYNEGSFIIFLNITTVYMQNLVAINSVVTVTSKRPHTHTHQPHLNDDDYDYYCIS